MHAELQEVLDLIRARIQPGAAAGPVAPAAPPPAAAAAAAARAPAAAPADQARDYWVDRMVAVANPPMERHAEVKRGLAAVYDEMQQARARG